MNFVHCILINYLYSPLYIANGKSPLAHLDEVREEHATLGLGSILGFKQSNTNKMRQRLVEFGVFSQRLGDYSPELLEKIIGGVIGNVSNPSFLSFYLQGDNPYSEENRKLIASSQQMKDYLSGIGVFNLDDVDLGNATKGLADILGFSLGSTRQTRIKNLDPANASGLDLIVLK